MSRLPKHLEGEQHAVAHVERVAKAGAGETITLSVSNETPMQRWWGKEILSHASGAVDLSRLKNGAAVLVDHYGDQVGVVEKAWVDRDKKALMVDIRLSRSARGQEVLQDIEDGIRKNVSVGYWIKKAKLDATDEDSGEETWRVTSWQPTEVSIVGVPANPTVGIGAGRASQGSVSARPEVVSIMDDAVKVERERVASLVALSKANDWGDPTDWIQRGLTEEQAALEIVRKKATQGAAMGATSMEALGMSEKEQREYSYARVIQMMVANADSGRPYSGLEFEVHRALEPKMLAAGLKPHGGVYVPMRLGKAALDTQTLTKGAELVREQPGEFIELLRNRTAIFMLGARNLTGLTSPVAFPKQTGAHTAYWVGENPSTDVTESDASLGLAILSPKYLMATTSWSRQLVSQSALDIEGLVRGDIAAVNSVAVDYAGFHGLGAAGEPTGAYKAVGVNAVAVGGAMSYDKALEMIGNVAGDNADLGQLGWAMHTTMASNLRGILDFPAAAAGRPVWTGTNTDGRVAGYKAVATNQLSTTMTGSERTGGSEIGAVFGNFADMIVGGFSGLEFIVDPLTLKKKAMIELTSYYACDILLRHGESFCKATGATG